MLFLYWSLYLYIMSFFFSFFKALKSTLSVVNIAYPHFLVISLYMNYYFPSSQFQSLCVFCLESLVGSISKVLGVCGVGDREVRVSPGCEAELLLCSVVITNLSGVGSDSKLLEQKPWSLGSSQLYSFYMCFSFLCRIFEGLFFFFFVILFK